jgi:hypothetical protein
MSDNRQSYGKHEKEEEKEAEKQEKSVQALSQSTRLTSSGQAFRAYPVQIISFVFAMARW